MSQTQPDGQRKPAIVILDFGSQYSELIARRVRETEVFSLVLGYSTSAAELREMAPAGIILSGGPSSVYAEGAPLCDPEIWNLGIPVLGVCYGMQLMVQQLGGVVEAATGKAEYGKAPLEVDDPTDLLTNVESGSTMWMSHGDSVKALPEGFVRLAHTANTPEAAVADHNRRLYGVQFHPEVVHSTCGMALIRNFVYHVCGCEPDWTTDAFIEEAVALVREQVGNKRVLFARLGVNVGARTLDHIGIKGALREVIERSETLAFLFKHTDEFRADDLALLLRIRDAVELLQKALTRIDVLNVNVELAIEEVHQELRLALPHEALIDEHAGELITDRLLEQEGEG